MEKKSVIKKITGSREALLAIIVVVLFAVVTVISPSFLTPKSLMEMLKNNAVTMVMSLGMLCVMLVGGIDISIMSTLALSGMSIGMLLKYGHITSTLLAFIIAMAIGIACGLVVGLVISEQTFRLSLQPWALCTSTEQWVILFPTVVSGQVPQLLVSLRICNNQLPWDQQGYLGDHRMLCGILLLYEMDKNRTKDLRSRK